MDEKQFVEEILSAINNESFDEFKSVLDRYNHPVNDIGNKIPFVSYASAWNDTRFLKALLSAGADPNAICKVDFTTPLFHATIKHNLPAIKILVEAGADINLPIIEKGTDCGDAGVSYSQYHGTTPLMVAASSNYFEITEYLLNNGADVGRQDIRGWTAMRWLSSTERFPSMGTYESKLAPSYKITKMLLEHGADISDYYHDGCIFIDKAQWDQNQKIVPYTISQARQCNYSNLGTIRLSGEALRNYDYSHFLQ